MAVYTRDLAKALQSSFDNSIVVRYAMTYGEPKASVALDEFTALGIQKLCVLPLFPQYSSTTTAPAIDSLFRAFTGRKDLPDLRIIRSYPLLDSYIRALADQVRESGFDPADRESILLISFHGIPARYSREGDPYFRECRSSAEALAHELGLEKERWTIGFQSRFGREAWLQPYTEKLVQELPGRGIRRMTVICPGFAVDCLETLEEIAIRNREAFLEAGGEDYRYLPSLNVGEAHLRVLTDLIIDTGFVTDNTPVTSRLDLLFPPPVQEKLRK